MKRFKVVFTNEAAGQIDCCVFQTDNLREAFRQAYNYRAAKVIDNQTGKQVYETEVLEWKN